MFSMFNRYITTLNRVVNSIEGILRYHKISFNTLDTLVPRKYIFNYNFSSELHKSYLASA